MKYFKKGIHIFLSFLLILSTIIVHPVEAWATLPNVPGGGTTFVPLPLVSLYETLRDTYNDGGTPFNFIKEAIKNSGFLSPEIPALKDLSSLDQYIGDNEPELKGDTPEDTAKNVSQFLVNNTQIVSDNSVKINSDVKNFNNNLINNYVNSNKINLFYACDLQASQQYFSSSGLLDITNIMTEHPNCYYIISQPLNKLYFWAIPIGSDKIYGVVNSVFSSEWSSIALYRCKNINGILTVDPVMAKDSNNYIYEYDGTNFNLVSDNSSISMSDSVAGAYFNINIKASTAGNEWGRYPKALTKTDQSIQVFNSLSSLNTYVDNTGIGIEPYYYNNTVWQDFSQSTGDYTFSPSNINTVTYGDTVSYVNDYHGTHNEYPDNSTVNNWINTTNNNNTGGGGSGGDESGDSGSDSPSDIFGWLKQLGAVLGSLIKGVGEFLTEIVTGLVSAINNLLSGISSLIQNITESLPTVFMDFLGTLFSWLPDEWLALFSASIIFMLLWGIIKTIRGS